MAEPDTLPTKRLEHLFEVKLQFRQGMTSINSAEGRGGEYIGSGAGTVKGARINITTKPI